MVQEAAIVNTTVFYLHYLAEHTTWIKIYAWNTILLFIVNDPQVMA